MLTALYSVLHFLTDGMCAFSMYAFFRESPRFYLYLLIYNFCAFALQMLFGAVMDVLKERFPAQAERLPLFCTFLGVLLTFTGAFLHPAILGCGNALFHVGGGIGVIREDRRKSLRGQALGIFVAPGALGLFLGGILGKQFQAVLPKLLFSAGMLVLFLLFLILLFLVQEKTERENVSKALPGSREKKELLSMSSGKLHTASFLAVILCFLVVVLRSFTGFSISFGWKSGFLFGLLATLAVVLGKMAGGVIAARFGMKETILASLILAGGCFFLKDTAVFGLLALFFFNMTMPLTLYLITERMRDLPGFSFGLLTLALFLGFLPFWLNLAKANVPGWGGALLSLLSLLCLGASCLLLEKEEKC